MKRDEKPNTLEDYIEMSKEKERKFWEDRDFSKHKTPKWTDQPNYINFGEETRLVYDDNTYTYEYGNNGSDLTTEVTWDVRTSDFSNFGRTISLYDISGGEETTMNIDLQNIVEEVLEERGIISPVDSNREAE